MMTAPQAVIAEICDLASTATGEKFVPQFAESYRDLAATLGSGKTGLAWMPPIPAVEAVVAGRADVGATYCNFEPGSKNLSNAAWTDFDGNNARAIDMLSSTGAIPNDAIVGTSKLPMPLRASVTRFFLELSPRGKQ